MTREKTKALLPIMQAFAEGKEILYSVGDGEWMEIEDPTWDIKKYQYKVKPEPIEIEVWMKNGLAWAIVEAGAPDFDSRFTKKKFREVVE